MILEDTSGGLWQLVITSLGQLNQVPATGTPSLLFLADQYGHPWQVTISTSGVLNQSQVSGTIQPLLLQDPLGNWWKVTVNALSSSEAQLITAPFLRPGAGSNRASVTSAVTPSGFDTLLLDTVAWDLVLDSNGNIALAGPPYAVAQDVASAIRLFLGELWFDTTQGVPYWQSILGYPPSLQTLAYYMNQAALSVPDVVSANTNINSFANRQVNGQVSIETADGAETIVRFQ